MHYALSRDAWGRCIQRAELRAIPAQATFRTKGRPQAGLGELLDISDTRSQQSEMSSEPFRGWAVYLVAKRSLSHLPLTTN